MLSSVIQADMQKFLIQDKDNANRKQNKMNSFIFMPQYNLSSLQSKDR